MGCWWVLFFGVCVCVFPLISVVYMLAPRLIANCQQLSGLFSKYPSWLSQRVGAGASWLPHTCALVSEVSRLFLHGR